MPNPFISVVNSLLAEPQASLLNGIIWGTKATMPKTFYNALIDTGTVHMIALSGMNITILSNLSGRATMWMGKRVSIISTLTIIVGFVTFVGPSPSVVRAALMGAISLVSLYFGRQQWTLMTLFLAGGIMALFDYTVLGSISFQLSFLATLGIILANKTLERQKDSVTSYTAKTFLKENLVLTLSAQLFTLPVILYNFHRISLIAPIANLLTEWAIQPIMILGFLTAFLGWIWLPLAMIPAYITLVPLTYVIWTIEFLARVPFASIQL